MKKNAPSLKKDCHVIQMQRKFAARSWILRILKHAGIPSESLVQVYCSLARPVLEYPSNAFHSTLTDESSEAFERLQRLALKSIYGLDKSYEHCLEKSGLPRLDHRRAQLFSDFAEKMSLSELFASTWFPLKEKCSYGLRKQEKYAQDFAASDCLKNAPIYAMRRLLNEKS